MRLVQIVKTNETMRLGNPIYDANNVLLAERKEVLTENCKRKLMMHGIENVYVVDELSEDIDVQDIISDNLRKNAIKNVQDLEVEKLEEIAKEIVVEISELKDIRLDMQDLRQHDNYTSCHCVNVAVLSTVIGVAMGLNDNQLIDVATSGLMHDIGKMKIKKEILNKNGRLTEWEMEEMKRHPAYSYAMLEKHYEIKMDIKQAVLNHHENIDGSGYPNGITGDNISLYAKILRAADTYDALTTERPYKKAFTPGEALEYLMGGCGIMFDKEVVENFIKYVPIYPRGISVELSDGRDAVIIDTVREYPLRPKVRLMTGKTLDLLKDQHLRNITVKRLKDKSYASDDELVKNENGRNKKAKKIILFSKDEVSLNSMDKILHDEYSTICIKNEEQIIMAARKKLPDMVIVDTDGINTPIAIAKKIKEIIKDKPPEFIFISSTADKNAIIDCKKNNIREYIIKPYKTLYMQDRVGTVLGNSKCMV